MDKSSTIFFLHDPSFRIFSYIIILNICILIFRSLLRGSSKYRFLFYNRI